MTTIHIGRTWQLWAHRYDNQKLWHIGSLNFIKLHLLHRPIVSVLVEEVIGDPYASEVTHYGWQYHEGSPHRRGDVPTMIHPRAGGDPERAMMLLHMCFPQGLPAAIRSGEGDVIALRVTERVAPQVAEDSDTLEGPHVTERGEHP